MSDDQRRMGPWAWAGALAVALLSVYLGFFVLIFLDEVVFQTRWIDPRLPGWMEHPLRVLYWPLITLVDWLGLV